MPTVATMASTHAIAGPTVASTDAIPGAAERDGPSRQGYSGNQGRNAERSNSRQDDDEIARHSTFPFV
jgi:hypothetical protein